MSNFRMNEDAIIEIRFRTYEEGGRKNSITGNFYSCPLIVGGEAFDCRIYLEGKVILLGHVYKLPVRFLFRELALPRLEAGGTISLWEGKEIADGRIISVKR